MSLQIGISESASLLYVRVKDTVTQLDIGGYHDRLKSFNNVGKCSKTIIDLTAPGLNLREASFSAISSLGQQFEQHPLLPPGARMAIVVSSNVAFGLTRIFMAFRNNKFLTIKPFRQMETALEWLEITRDDIPSQETGSYIEHPHAI